MIRFSRWSCILILVLMAETSSARILWGESSKPVDSKSRFNYDKTEDAREVSQFWAQNKMSIGVGLAGYHGLGGGVFGIHFHPDWAIELAYGGGSHFQSYGMRGKRYFLRSSALSPYFGFGFHRWQRITNRPFAAESVVPNAVARRFLSEADLRDNRIDERLGHAGLGIEYIFTSGDWAGIALSAELLFIASLEDFRSMTTLSVGMSYFF